MGGKYIRAGVCIDRVLSTAAGLYPHSSTLRNGTFRAAFPT